MLTCRPVFHFDRWALAWIEARSFGWGRLLGGQWLALDGRRTCGWLACDAAGRARGYALVERRENRPYVPGIGVLPEWRRRGIGEQLMRLVLGAHRDVWLHVREGNLSARRLYARLGLRETGRVPHFYSDDGDHNLDHKRPTVAGPTRSIARQRARVRSARIHKARAQYATRPITSGMTASRARP
ncbi:MAG: N-acetyltransferase [Thermoflexales bacterium]